MYESGPAISWFQQRAFPVRNTSAEAHLPKRGFQFNGRAEK
jgi:hypothetical protein